MRGVRFQMSYQGQLRWHSYQKFYLTLLFGVFLFVAGLTESLTGDLTADIVSLIGFLLVVASLIAIARKGVWVEINEFGVTYRNLFGNNTLKWKDISHSYTLKIKLTTSLYIKCTSGKSVTLPITGSKAKAISDTINSRVNET